MNRSISYIIRYEEVSTVQERDLFKQSICQRNGITLITIPYWWNRKIESVASAIRSLRPDIPFDASLLNGDVIPQVMPKKNAGKGTKSTAYN